MVKSGFLHINIYQAENRDFVGIEIGKTIHIWLNSPSRYKKQLNIFPFRYEWVSLWNWSKWQDKNNKQIMSKFMNRRIGKIHSED